MQHICTFEHCLISKKLKTFRCSETFCVYRYVCVRVCVCVCARVCVLCVCLSSTKIFWIYTCVHAAFISRVCVCVCVCVCECALVKSSGNSKDAPSPVASERTHEGLGRDT